VRVGLCFSNLYDQEMGVIYLYFVNENIQYRQMLASRLETLTPKTETSALETETFALAAETRP